MSLLTASAASLGLSTNNFGAGDAAIAKCGSMAAASVTYSQSSGSVTSVVVANLPTACGGGRLSVTLVGAGGTALGSAGPVVLPSVASPGATFTISPSVPASSVIRSDLVIVGP
jgi:hypothetical protein